MLPVLLGANLGIHDRSLARWTRALNPHISTFSSNRLSPLSWKSKRPARWQAYVSYNDGTLLRHQVTWAFVLHNGDWLDHMMILTPRGQFFNLDVGGGLRMLTDRMISYTFQCLGCHGGGFFARSGERPPGSPLFNHDHDSAIVV